MYELYREALEQAAYRTYRQLNCVPRSASPRAWHAMQAVQKGRLTEVSSTEAFLDASQPDSMTSGSCIEVFNRQAILGEGRVWGLDGQPFSLNQARIRAGEPLAWFHPADPGFIRFSSEGMVPLESTKELVFLSAVGVKAAEDMLKQPLEETNRFVAESVMIGTAYTRALQGHPAYEFETLKDAATILGLPRLEAFARKTAVMIQQGAAYPRRPYVRPQAG